MAVGAAAPVRVKKMGTMVAVEEVGKSVAVLVGIEVTKTTLEESVGSAVVCDRSARRHGQAARTLAGTAMVEKASTVTTGVLVVVTVVVDDTSLVIEVVIVVVCAATNAATRALLVDDADAEVDTADEDDTAAAALEQIVTPAARAAV